MQDQNKVKIRVAVLAGGISSEREVSLSTGQQVMANLNKAKFEPIFYDTKNDLPRLFSDAQQNKIDVCFIALHGKGGEDGTIQSMLDLLDKPYIGSGVLASAIGMDKEISKKLFVQDNIPTADFVVFKDKKPIIAENIAFPLPWVIKPANGGSSIGVSIIEKADQLAEAVALAKQYDSKVLIEEYLHGMEITVGVLGNDQPTVLPVVEICPKNKFFDYQAKYSAEFCQEIVPARISKSIAQKAQMLAIKVYQALGCSGFGRVDFILKDNQEPMALEINTIPGLTPNSLLPKAAKAAGISFPELLEKVIGFALEKKSYGKA